eukprot:9155404-Alexandrium_andersonii.AAC.1
MGLCRCACAGACACECACAEDAHRCAFQARAGPTDQHTAWGGPTARSFVLLGQPVAGKAAVAKASAAAMA